MLQTGARLVVSSPPKGKALSSAVPEGRRLICGVQLRRSECKRAVPPHRPRASQSCAPRWLSAHRSRPSRSLSLRRRASSRRGTWTTALTISVSRTGRSPTGRALSTFSVSWGSSRGTSTLTGTQKTPSTRPSARSGATRTRTRSTSTRTGCPATRRSSRSSSRSTSTRTRRFATCWTGRGTSTCGTRRTGGFASRARRGT